MNYCDMEQPTKKLRKRSKSTSQRETPEVKSPELDLNGAAKVGLWGCSVAGNCWCTNGEYNF